MIKPKLSQHPNNQGGKEWHCEYSFMPEIVGKGPDTQSAYDEWLHRMELSTRTVKCGSKLFKVWA